jgi:DNA repair exonuclease SbcCD ATPase subunit
MKVTTLRVHGFGRLGEREFTFGPGLTIVHGPNESGKSTLHAALSASIFGLVPSGRRSPKHTAVIERHRPWHGDRYAATVELERTDARRLRLDWDHDKQRFAVIDAATGDDLSSAHGAGTNADVLSETLYGVGRDVYLRVGSVGQEELAEIATDSTGVREAIERAAGQSQTDSSSQAAIDRLRARRKELVGLNRNPANALPRAEASAAQIRAELSQANGARAEAEQLSAERDEAAEQAQALDRRIRGLEFALEGARWRSLRTTVDRAERMDRELQAAAAVVQGSVAVADFHPIPGIDGARERYEHLRTEQIRIAPRRAAAERELGALRSPPMDAAANPPGRPSRAGWIVALAGAIVVAAGLAVSVVVAVAGAVAVVAGVGLATTTRRAHDARREQFRETCDREAAERREQAARHEVELAKIATVESEFEATRDRLAAMLETVDPDPEELSHALATYDARLRTHAGLIEAERRRERAEAELARLLDGGSLEQAQTRCLELERSLNGHRDAAGAERDPADIEAELTRLRAQSQHIAVRQSGLVATAAERLRLVPDAGALQEQLDAAEEELQRLQHAEAVLKLAEAELQLTMTETYRDFAPRLNAALERNLERATNGRYRKAYVADDLSVRLEAPETSAVVDLAQVSTGTQRLVYLVQRLELVQLIAPTTEPLPVLLDEPFAHLDPDRMRAALAVLADLSTDRQIVVFTTQSEAADLAPADTTILTLE